MAIGEIINLVLNGLFYAAFLYMVSLGLSLVFGVLNLVNLQHASFLGLGAYVGASVSTLALTTFDSVIAPLVVILAVTPLIGVIIAIAMEKTVIAILYEIKEEYQMLATFGLLLMFEDIFTMIWGSNPVSNSTPVDALGSISIFGVQYPVYYLFVIGMFGITAYAPFVLFRRTKLGHIARAMAEDEEMVRMIGINTDRVRLIIFAVAAGLAALGGALLVPSSSAVPGLSVNYVVLAFAVTVIGGLGSLRGAIAGSLIIGLVRSFGIVYVPSVEMVIVFLIMIAMILVKPEGLFGGQGVIE